MAKYSRIIIVGLGLAAVVGMAWWVVVDTTPKPAPATVIETPIAPPLSPSVTKFLYARGIWDRREAMKALPRRLSIEEQTNLFTLLGDPCPADLGTGEWQTLVNDTLDRLCAFNSAPEGMSKFLIALWRNEKTDPILREYALQFMGNWHTTKSRSAGSEQNPVLRGELVVALEESLGQPQHTGSAVALLSLERIDEAELSLGRDEIAPATYTNQIQTLISAEANPAVRVTALQVAARLNLPEALPLARKLAFDEKQRPVMRLSAIAAIGQLGDASDSDALRQLSVGQEERLRFASLQALNRLEPSQPAEPASR